MKTVTANEFGYNQRKYKLTLLRFADIIIRADVTMVHDKTIVWTIPAAPMQEILDAVYNRLVCDYQRAKYLWDLELVKRWGALPASLSQISYLKKTDTQKPPY